VSPTYRLPRLFVKRHAQICESNSTPSGSGTIEINKDPGAPPLNSKLARRAGERSIPFSQGTVLLSFLRIRDFMGGVEPNRENEILGNIMGDRALRSRLSVAPQPGEALGALAFTQTIIRAFNRNTTYFAAGLQLSVGFAILVLAFQEANQNVTGQTEARPNGDKLSLSAHPDLGPAEAVDPSANNIDNLTSIQATKAEPELVPGANLPISRPQIHGLQGKRHFGTFNARNSRSAPP